MEDLIKEISQKSEEIVKNSEKIREDFIELKNYMNKNIKHLDALSGFIKEYDFDIPNKPTEGITGWGVYGKTNEITIVSAESAGFVDEYLIDKDYSSEEKIDKIKIEVLVKAINTLPDFLESLLEYVKERNAMLVDTVEDIENMLDQLD